LFPSVFIGQFAEIYSEGRIYEALLNLGFTHIFEVEQPASWLMESIKESGKENAEGPLISSFCPAIVRLIQCKYPSLTGNIARRKAPHDLAAHFAIQQLKNQGAAENEIGIFYVSPCSAKMAAVNEPVAPKEVWITLQTHQNVMAIASLKDLAAVILVKGFEPDEDTLARSHEEGIPLLGTKLGTFEMAGKLYADLK